MILFPVSQYYKGKHVKKQFDSISNVYKKYISNENENVDLYQCYEKCHEGNDYTELNSKLEKLFSKIGSGYSKVDEGKPTNYILKYYASRFEIKLKKTDEREMLEEICKHKNEIEKKIAEKEKKIKNQK
jgi:predicted CopG family antitoxin